MTVSHSPRPGRVSFMSSTAEPSTIAAPVASWGNDWCGMQVSAQAYSRSGRPIPKRVPGGALIAMLCMTMLLGLGGCVLAPVGTLEEQAKLDSVAPTFEPPVEARQL